MNQAYADALELLKVRDRRIRELEGLLTELIDIEGPQPGHVMWARKVEAALDRKGEHDNG